jgi:hypothetical protein
MLYVNLRGHLLELWQVVTDTLSILPAQANSQQKSVACYDLSDHHRTLASCSVHLA